jgi:hypothetical protein
MSLCGLILLAAVIVPVTGMYESQAAVKETDISDSLSSMVDDFYYSKMETFVVSMSEILPNASSYLELNGHLVTLTTERGVYRSGTNVPMIVEKNTLFGYGDILRLSRADGAVMAERLT